MSRKTLQDYQYLASSRGWKYLSTTFPTNVNNPGGLFECEYGHQWNSSSYSNLRKGCGCPQCADFSKNIKDYQILADSKGWKYLSTTIPKNVSTPGGIFQCEYGHQWNTSTYNSLNHGCGCPICSNVSKTLEDYQQLAISRGFKYLSNDIPQNVSTPGGIFECEYGHQWNTGCYNSLQKGCGCPCCLGLVKKTLKDYQELALSKGFKYLSNTIPLNTVIKGGLFECENGHQLNSISYNHLQQGHGCSRCVGLIPKTLQDYQTVAGNKGRYILDYIPKNAATSIEGWLCYVCNQNYTSTYNNISSGHWCSCIKNKTEAILKEILLKHFAQLIHQFKPDWLINPITGRKLAFDFLIVIGQFKIIIELDGNQHFQDVAHFKSSAEDNRKRDVYKMKMANLNNYYIIRIVQEDVLHNKMNYLERLFYCINEIVTLRITNTNFYIGLENGIYNNHMSEYSSNQNILETQTGGEL